MAQNTRSNVLSVYKKILRVAKLWESRSGNVADTLKERNYIKDEAKLLFRNNKFMDNNEEINKKLSEAEARLTIALHYKNPYPRPVNVPPKTFAKPTNLKPSAKHQDNSL